MTTAVLHINLQALVNNWQALHAKTGDTTETAAVVKADGYGLGAAATAQALYEKGVKTFFVAAAEEGEAVRRVCRDATIYVFSGYMPDDAEAYRDSLLLPLLNSPAQWQQWQTDMGSRAFGLQLDSGMNRLGFEPDEFNQIANDAQQAKLLISHLACADEPDHPMNQQQLQVFHQMTDEVVRETEVPRSLAATGGVLLGSDYHFDMVRPGIGLYGGLPFIDAQPVVRLSLPVIQTRTVQKGETVGYGGTWCASRDTRVATLAAGYADGIIRALGGSAGNQNKNDKDTSAAKPVSLYSDGVACPMVGRVSMDMLTVDVTELDGEPQALDLINAFQSIDDVATIAGTIGYEILTACGNRYRRIITS